MDENYPGAGTPGDSLVFRQMLPTNNNTSNEINLSTPDKLSGLHSIIAYQWVVMYLTGGTAYNHLLPVSALAKIISDDYHIRMTTTTVLKAIKHDGRFVPKYVDGEWLLKINLTVKRRKF
jgi:hypothetical protein